MSRKKSLVRWLRAATPAEKRALTFKLGMTTETLRLLGHAYRTSGKPHARADTAIRIERAVRRLARPGLPEVLRGDLCPACAQCEYAKAAIKNHKD